MSIGIISIKKNLANLQDHGKWNEALRSLIELPELFNDASLDTLCISEMYWLLENRDFFDHNNKDKPNGYENIIWDFQHIFDDLVSFSIKNNEDDVRFLWETGTLILTDSSPFFNKYSGEEIEHIGKQMLTKAAFLSKDEPYHDLVLLTQGNIPSVYNKCSNNKEKLYIELSSLQLQDNLSGANFYDLLCHLIQAL